VDDDPDPLPDLRQPVTVTVCDESFRLLLLRLCSEPDCPAGCPADCAPTATAMAAENTVPNINSRLIQSLPR